MSQKRIEFIDLAKGICMILLVIGHCGVNVNGASTLPLYLMISGMFFKEYNNTRTFLKKKINGILVPFIFFYLIGYIAFYGIKLFAPSLLITSSESIFDVFNNRQFFNGPIWFIITLFWCNIYLYIIYKTVTKEYIRIIISTFIGLVGWFLGRKGIFVPMYLDVAMTSLPFFILGYYMKQSAIINNTGNVMELISGVCMIIVATIIPSRISLHYNIMEGINSYIVGILVAIGILFICKKIVNITFITYCGHYSLVLLCVHHMIYRPLIVIMQKTGIELLSNNWSIAIMTLLLSVACIPVCKKFIPWFVAQKDLIK